MKLKSTATPLIDHHLNLLLHDPGALDRLRAVAANQLRRVGLTALDPEDLLQEAVLAVLRGTTSRRRGRHPGAPDLVDTPAFERWLNDVLNSLATNWARV